MLSRCHTWLKPPGVTSLQCDTLQKNFDEQQHHLLAVQNNVSHHASAESRLELRSTLGCSTTCSRSRSWQLPRPLFTLQSMSMVYIAQHQSLQWLWTLLTATCNKSLLGYAFTLYNLICKGASDTPEALIGRKCHSRVGRLHHKGCPRTPCCRSLQITSHEMMPQQASRAA